MGGPLEGIKVLDFTRYQQGPYATVMLSDMGAEVIKVEQPGCGDPGRRIGLRADGFSTYFEANDRGKKSITLDLRQPQAREIVYKLVEAVDVVTENFRPGVMERLGLGYEALAATNPRLIYASASGFGAYGPWARRPSYDAIAQAVGGIMVAQGQMDGGSPRPMLGGSADQAGALTLACGILAALVARERLGVGQKVDVSLYGSQIAFQALHVMAGLYDKAPLVPPGAGSPIITHRGQCGDGHWLAFGILSADAWPALCRALGLEDLTDNELFATPEARGHNMEQLMALFDSTLRARPAAEWLERLAAEDIPCGLVQDYATIGQEAQALANGYVTTVQHPRLGAIKEPGLPILFSHTPGGVQGSAPALGEHTKEILSDLGYSAQEIARLRAGGAI
ncbi:MAG: CaiB/BaiF CoA transferase family protein [Dehalococcoidia bacterium]